MDGERFEKQPVDGLARMERAVGVLEDHLDLAEEGPRPALPGTDLAVDGDASRRDRREPDDGAEQRRFPRAGFADEAEGFAPRDPDAHVAERVEMVEGDAEPVDPQRVRHAAHSGRRSRTGSG